MLINLINFLFPPICVHCRREGDWLCPVARQMLKQEKLMINPIAINGVDRVIVRGSYDCLALQQLVQRLKYHYWTGLTPVLIDVLKPLESMLVAEHGVIVPVPLHRRRYLDRGYNQAELISHSLSTVINQPIKQLLRRQRQTHAQAQLSEAERLTNLVGAFTAVPNITSWPKSAIIVDDVITTGSTIVECAAILRQHGVSQIIAVALAKG